MGSAMIRISVAAIALVVISQATAFAQNSSFDVQHLYTQCKDSASQVERAICIGYISGIGAVMKANGALLKSGGSGESARSLGLCGSPTNGAMEQAFKNWAEKSPQYWNEDEAVGAIVALSDT